METPESMQQLEELFHEAAGLDSQQRADFIARVRDTNPGLAVAVESLIAAHERTHSFIDSPVYEAAAESIAQAQPVLVAGQVVDHYQIVAPLGKVALKLLPAEFTNRKDLLRRFIQEAKAASSLNHPNIITIHEIGQRDGVHYIATEFIDGQTLKLRMKLGRLEFAEVLDVSIQVASALEAAHAAGLVHRDIKPENIMVRRDGYVKVLDFGLAKLTEKSNQSQGSEVDTMVRGYTKPGTVLGTVDYMSPEQARGKVLDQRTDVFSLGIVLYEMAAGRMPFAAATSIDTLVSILEKEPAQLDEYAPEVPTEFQRIVSKALRKDREERYQTIKDLLVDLKSLREELSFAKKLESSSPPRSSARLSTNRATSEAPTTIHTRAVAPDTALSAPKSTRRNGHLVPVALVGLVLAGLTIASAMLWQRRASAPVIPTPATSVDRRVSYWITVQKYRDGKPYQDPFRLRDDINFEKDYRIRLNLTSSQSGRLYLLNEGPVGADQIPTFNVLFPSETANNGSALLNENQQIQIPEQSWIQFDEQQGTEKVWLVWASQEVPEMEAIKGFANPTDRGVISSPGLRTAVNQFLKAHSSPSPAVERDDDKKETVVKATGEILVHVIKLEHH